MSKFISVLVGWFVAPIFCALPSLYPLFGDVSRRLVAKAEASVPALIVLWLALAAAGSTSFYLARKIAFSRFEAAFAVGIAAASVAGAASYAIVPAPQPEHLPLFLLGIPILGVLFGEITWGVCAKLEGRKLDLLPPSSQEGHTAFPLRGAFVFRPRRPLWLYCLLCVPLALIPSLALSFAAWTLLQLAGVDVAAHFPPVLDTSTFALAGLLCAPIVETALLAGIVAVLFKASANPLVVAIASALIWGCLHAVSGAMSFFGTVWSFFVMTCAYIAWRRVSFGHGFAAAAVPHAAINLCALLGLMAARSP